jgi:hypothetical protein
MAIGVVVVCKNAGRPTARPRNSAKIRGLVFIAIVDFGLKLFRIKN